MGGSERMGFPQQVLELPPLKRQLSSQGLLYNSTIVIILTGNLYCQNAVTVGCLGRLYLVRIADEFL